MTHRTFFTKGTKFSLQWMFHKRSLILPFLRWRKLLKTTCQSSLMNLAVEIYLHLDNSHYRCLQYSHWHRKHFSIIKMSQFSNSPLCSLLNTHQSRPLMESFCRFIKTLRTSSIYRSALSLVIYRVRYPISPGNTLEEYKPWTNASLRRDYYRNGSGLLAARFNPDIAVSAISAFSLKSRTLSLDSWKRYRSFHRAKHTSRLDFSLFQRIGLILSEELVTRWFEYRSFNDRPFFIAERTGNFIGNGVS